MLRNHSIIVIIFALINFKRRLSRRDMKERFLLSTAEDKVKIPKKKRHEVSRDHKVWPH
jgi:hypothetical protein